MSLKYDVPAGDPGRPCEACGKTIRFVKTEAGKWIPIDWDGTPHWETCPNADDFRKYPKRKMDEDQKDLFT